MPSAAADRVDAAGVRSAFEPVARLADKHELITSGPYRIVRHPIYSAMLGLLIATGVAMSEFLPTLVAAAIYTGATMMRVESEERLLASAFGAAHRDISGGSARSSPGSGEVRPRVALHRC